MGHETCKNISQYFTVLLVPYFQELFIKESYMIGRQKGLMTHPLCKWSHMAILACCERGEPEALWFSVQRTLVPAE